ncbi:hypothetical protein ACS0TY_030310 [Phlomoides rotata]
MGILINGAPSWRFCPTRGLRQGILCPHAYSCSVLRHDTLVFRRAIVHELIRIKEILNIYAEASGQVINLVKSDILFINGIGEEMGHSLARLLGVRRVDQHSIYLGIPTAVRGSRTNIFKCLVDRVEKNEISGTSNTDLMTCFKTPSGIITRIEATMIKFIWGQKNDERHMH